MRPAKLVVAVVIAALAVGCVGAIATLAASPLDHPATALVVALVGGTVLGMVSLGVRFSRQHSTPYW